mmetsp:Transcript_44338/g.106810  ORF Transcript_44338/g.106810 Transcript_44338/m.106810 type:complete len:229 (-) Transcript_44338:154-840(-)|eukprot:CAMPEP_0113644930 /NCGR_PEP_ID=MMETSP0017_2-20120614/23657_1 /TAXON_ID=2856 /ORGANISM="Cylindrotheca closterium" /LENGTH=228 /DNA_ID=CAMNT_0000556587 /DNA_START=35 /DNA_END=721 /DNA_ORIENTATION=+ /assembly_acc=CAM_ASM_000147
MAPAEESSNGNTGTEADKQQQGTASSPVDASEAGAAVDDIAADSSMNDAVDEAAADADDAIASEGGNDDVKAKKRKERLEQNRISARESRKRKKTMIEELQRTVITLSKENKELTDRNDNLRTQLMEIASKYPNVVPLQAIMNGAPAAQVGVNHTAQQLQQQQQQQQAAAVAAAAQATYNPLAYWPQQQQQQAQGLSHQQQAQQQQVHHPHVTAPGPAVTPPDAGVDV